MDVVVIVMSGYTLPICNSLHYRYEGIYATIVQGLRAVRTELMCKIEPPAVAGQILARQDHGKIAIRRRLEDAGVESFRRVEKPNLLAPLTPFSRVMHIFEERQNASADGAGNATMNG